MKFANTAVNTAAFLSAITLACAAQAQVTVKEPWVRATVPAAKATGAFMQIESAQDARLVEVRSNVAGVVEIHQMAMDNGMMKMGAVEGIDLPAGKPVALASGGYHVMLMQLKQQIKEGDTVPLTLVVQRKDRQRETIEVKAQVKPLSYTPAK